MSSRSISLSLGSLLLAAGFLAAVVDLGAPRPPNVILLTVESLRADSVGPGPTPALWRAAREGTRFDGHRVVSAWTAANIVSLLTGLPPAEHRVHSRGRSLAAEWRTPLEDLAAAGWHPMGLQPFMQVQVFDQLGLDIAPGQPLRYRLAAAAGERRPFFLWHHYLETHLPYAPEEPFRPDWRALLPAGDAEAEARIAAVMRLPAIPAGSVDYRAGDLPAIRALYDGGVREFDAWFAEFWCFLEESGLRRDTILVVTTDHGEELLERGEVGHASTTRAGHLHEEVVRVPLIIWLPPGDDRLPRGAAIEAATDHLDVMPTLMALLGERPTTPLPGRSLLDGAAARPWFGMTSFAGYAEADPDSPAGFVHAVVEGRWKLHLRRPAGGGAERTLHDLDADPGETTDLSAAEPDIVRRLEGLIEADLAAAREPPRAAVAAAAPGPPPRWAFPSRDGLYRYDDVDGRFMLAWTGPEEADYVIEYEVGRGLLAFGGRMEVRGNRKDFGEIDRRYWETWIVPYSPVRIRVGYAGDDPRWSPWLELEAAP